MRSDMERERPVTDPAIADLIVELCARGLGHRAGTDDAVIDPILELLGEDLSAALDPAAVAAGITAGVLEWDWFPTCSQIVKAAQPFVNARAADNRRRTIEREDAARRRALPAPENPYDKADGERAMADFYAALSASEERSQSKAPAATIRTGRETWNDHDNDAIFGRNARPRVPYDDGTGPSTVLLNLARSRGLVPLCDRDCDPAAK
jgi:hypothetical protein